MTGIGGDTDPIRARLDELEAWFPCGTSLFREALLAVLDVNQEHRDLLTHRGRWPERAEECHCLGCDSVRAVADALGVPNAD